MSFAFDPSRFIKAEEARYSQTVAAPATDYSWPATVLKRAENCGFQAPRETRLAAIATIAGGDRETLPWNREIQFFVDSPCPADIRAEFWNELIEEAWTVHRNWGAIAFDAGWSVIDLFGCNPDPTARRLDRNGLVAGICSLLSPVRLTAITAAHAVLEPRRGPAIRHYRSPAPGSVPLWVAYANSTGP